MKNNHNNENRQHESIKKMYINSHNDDVIDNSSNIVAFLDKVLFKNRTKIKKCVYVCMYVCA